MEPGQVDKKEPELCFYHNDADGRCSAAIVRRALGKHTILWPMNYGDTVPWDEVANANMVVIVDFSLSRNDMKRIVNEVEVVWIDHHKTAIEGLMEFSGLQGLRRTDAAGCVLTWEYYFPSETEPRVVTYIGDRDIWRHAYPETRPFGEALFHEDTRPENDDLWEPLLDDEGGRIETLVTRGNILYDARKMHNSRTISRYGFEVEFEGYRTLAINVAGTGDLGEAIRARGYEIAYCYIDVRQGVDLITSVTLYSDQVDVSEIALRFGGGGHPGAAGFSFSRTDSPFPPGADIL